MKKATALTVINIKNWKILKYIKMKKIFLSTFCNMCGSKDAEIPREEESIKTLKTLVLINTINKEYISHI